MKKSTALLCVGAVLLIAALTTWYWLTFYKRVTREVDLPMRGEARYNALYGLELSLRAMGQRADSYARIDLTQLKLAPNDTLVLYSTPAGLSETQVTQLLAWIESGGHLVVPAPSAFGLSENTPLMAKLGISTGEYYDECLSFKVKEEKNFNTLCGEYFYSENMEAFDWYYTNDESLGYLLGRMRWGKGYVTVASTLDFMDNRELDRSSSHQLMYQLLADSMNRGRFLLVYDTDIAPFWLLILKHGWVLLLSLLVLLIAWLVYRSQRFGPLMASPNPDRRALLEHVSATGEYMFKRHLVHELHLATLALFTARLRRRDPVTAALTGEAQIAALAERTKMDPQKIRQAFTPGSLRQKENFFHSIATLIQLRNQL
jgi:hypothetical protein